MTMAVISRERLRCWTRAQAAVLASLVLAARVQAAGPVILSEFMAANTRTLADETRSFEDWIEIRNTGSNAVDLAGWSLTTKPNRPREWIFPAMPLPPGGLLLVWASGRDRRLPGAPLHTNFRLSRAGEYLALVRPDGSLATEFKPAFPP